MSRGQILKNVYTFLDILQMSLSDSVKELDRVAVDHALRWANYCQKLYDQAIGKPYREELDLQIQQLGQLPWLLGQVKVNLDMMSQADQLLKKALLQNPQTPMPIVEYLFTFYQLHTETGRQTFTHMCRELNQDQSECSLLCTLTSTLTDQSDASRKAQAVTLTSQMYRTFAQSQPNNLQSVKQFVKKHIIMLAEKPNIMAILVEVLKHGMPEVEDPDDNMINCMKSVILQAIMELPLEHRKEFKRLMTADGEPTS